MAAKRFINGAIRNPPRSLARWIARTVTIAPHTALKIRQRRWTESLATGRIDHTLPKIKEQGLALLKQKAGNPAEALRAFYQSQYPDDRRGAGREHHEGVRRTGVDPRPQSVSGVGRRLGNASELSESPGMFPLP